MAYRRGDYGVGGVIAFANAAGTEDPLNSALNLAEQLPHIKQIEVARHMETLQRRRGQAGQNNTTLMALFALTIQGRAIEDEIAAIEAADAIFGQLDRFGVDTSRARYQLGLNTGHLNLSPEQETVRNKIIATVRQEMAGRPQAEVTAAIQDALGIAYVESTFQNHASPETSSAEGVFQFVKGTWASTMPGVPLSSRHDVATSTRAFLKLRAQNIAALESRGITNPNTVEIYAAHFMGADRAASFVRAPGNAIAENLVSGNAARANKWVFYHNGGQGAPKDVSEILNGFAAKLGKGMSGVDVAVADTMDVRPQ